MPSFFGLQVLEFCWVVDGFFLDPLGKIKKGRDHPILLKKSHVHIGWFADFLVLLWTIFVVVFNWRSNHSFGDIFLVLCFIKLYYQQNSRAKSPKQHKPTPKRHKPTKAHQIKRQECHDFQKALGIHLLIDPYCLPTLVPP